MLQRGFILAAVAAIGLGAAQTLAQQEPPPRSVPEAVQQIRSATELTPFGRQFIEEALKGNLGEVKLGQLAMLHGQLRQVKDFAQHMIEEHSQANDRLAIIAKEQGIQVPTDMSQKMQDVHARLSGLKGDAFDRAYTSFMLEDHKAEIERYTTALDEAREPSLREYINKTLPLLRQHLAAAQAIEKALQPVAGGGAERPAGEAGQSELPGK